jgi:hypothetical protein
VFNLVSDATVPLIRQGCATHRLTATVLLYVSDRSEQLIYELFLTRHHDMHKIIIIWHEQNKQQERALEGKRRGSN